MTMKQELIDIFAGLKTQWGILKNDKLSDHVRKQSCEKIIKLSEQAKVLDPKFEMIDMNNTMFSEFVPDKYIAKTDVHWVKPIDITDCNNAVKSSQDVLDDLESLAVIRTKQRLPKERMDSQKFGMIVSNYTEKYIALYIHFDK